MAQTMSAKEAQAALIDPFSTPEPNAETGLNAHFGSTFAPKQEQQTTGSSTLSSNNPFNPSHDRRTSSNTSPPHKGANVKTHSRNVSNASNGSSRERFPNYRAEAFGDFDDAPRRRSGSGSRATPPSYHEATSSTQQQQRRRGSSLTARFPGDKSHEPLDIIRRDSKKADRSPHLRKKHMPGPDTIDKLDPAFGGRAYHHEGPYDAALLARNTSYKSAPIAALEDSNREALKATPAENVKDSLDRHMPLDGVAAVPPGVPDRFGRTYQYEEGTDLMREGTSDAGYRRWSGKSYDKDDLKGKAEPAFTLDRALAAHKIDDNGIEMADRAGIDREYHRAQKNGTLDTRDPVKIAGDDAKYSDLQHANDTDLHNVPDRRSSVKDGLKKRIGSLRHRRNGSQDE